jgi:NADPH:quinone reductase
VLIHGAAGGIGGAAIQIAKTLGAIPIAVVSNTEKAAYAKNLGATHVIDHSREDFVARVKDITSGTGVDRILDMTGGDYLPRNIEAAARGAHIVQVASLSGQKSEINAGLIVAKWLTLSGSTLRPQPAEAKAAIATSLRQHVWPHIEANRIAPPRIRTFSLTEAATAHIEMEKRENYGKILLVTAFGAAAS